MLKKLKRFYYENQKVVLTETFYMKPDSDKDMGDIIHIFDRHGFKILDMRYLTPAMNTNYKAAVQFTLSGKAKNACMYETYMKERYKPFEGPNELVHDEGVELT